MKFRTQNKERRKYTLMIFENSEIGRVYNITLSLRFINIIIFSLVLLVTLVLLGVAFFFMFNSTVRTAYDYKEENSRLLTQLKDYDRKLSTIEVELNSIKGLEADVRKALGIVPPLTDSLLIPEDALHRSNQSLSLLGDVTAEMLISDVNSKIDNITSALSFSESYVNGVYGDILSLKLLVASTPTLYPARGWLTSRFGYRITSFSTRRTFHEGIDIGSPYGSGVYSTADGIIIYAGYRVGYGNLVVVDHGYGYTTRYGHNSKLTVAEGDFVKKGDVIALIGSSGRSTGPHTHYEVLINGMPVDPVPFLISKSF